MRSSTHTMPKIAGLIMAIASVAFGIGCAPIEVAHDRLDLERNPDAKNADAVANLSVPRISMIVSRVDFSVESSDSHPVLNEFSRRLSSSIQEFNAVSSANLGLYTESDQFSALCDEFKSQGKITVHTEPSRTIAIDDTDEWGDTVSIVASPRYGPDETFTVYVSLTSSGIEFQSTLSLPMRQTIELCGSYSTSVSTPARRIPVLSDIPSVGKWFEFPATRPRGEHTSILLTATLASGSATHAKRE